MPTETTRQKDYILEHPLERFARYPAYEHMVLSQTYYRLQKHWMSVHAYFLGQEKHDAVSGAEIGESFVSKGINLEYRTWFSDRKVLAVLVRAARSGELEHLLEQEDYPAICDLCDAQTGTFKNHL